MSPMQLNHCVLHLVSLATSTYSHLRSTCDMIKGNESDVGNIDFEIQVYGGDKFLCFTLI